MSNCHLTNPINYSILTIAIAGRMALLLLLLSTTIPIFCVHAFEAYFKLNIARCPTRRNAGPHKPLPRVFSPDALEMQFMNPQAALVTDDVRRDLSRASHYFSITGYYLAFLAIILARLATTVKLG